MSLLVLFQQAATPAEEGGFAVPSGDAPSLPDLYIMDADSKVATPVGGVSGWDSDYIQTVAVHKAPLTFQSAGVDMSADSYTSSFWCRRLSSMLVDTRFSDAGANCVIRIAYADSNNKMSVSQQYTINATAIDDTGYVGEMLSVETYGANYIGVYVETVSAGTVSVNLAGV